jgi:hypothetical protein
MNAPRRAVKAKAAAGRAEGSDTSDPQRGTDPPNAIGTAPPPPTPPDPKFQPDPALLKQLMAEFRAKADRGRPNREDVLPYLLVRAFAPGDRGARPTWPPTPCWESPDLLLIDASYTGPFDPSRCVGTPVSGNTYRVFVRVFNLGMLPAVGTQVTVYWIDPGFFSGQPGMEPNLIGAAYAEFADRTRAESVGVVEVQPPWVIPLSLTGHECLLATVSTLADPWRGAFDANHDRHVGQRNLNIAAGHLNLNSLIGQLGTQIPAGGALEIMHGGQAVIPLLTAVSGGRLKDSNSAPSRYVAPNIPELRHGVLSGGELHLMTAVRRASDFVVCPTEVVTSAATRTALARVTAILRDASPSFANNIAVSGANRDAPSLLTQAIRRMLDIGNLEAGSIAAALGGSPDTAHLLRFIATDAEGALVGGYSIVVAQK